jgi:hypothetical protein
MVSWTGQSQVLEYIISWRNCVNGLSRPPSSFVII